MTVEALVFDRVHARDTAGPNGRARGALTDVSLTFGPGVHAILGSPEDGTIAFVEALTGARRPSRGTVLVAGRDPTKLPFLRARIGVLSPDPQLVPARSVGASVRLSMRARGEGSQSFDAILDPLGLSRLHARKVPSLGYAEARAVELALALSTPAPYLVALHEPFSDVAIASSAPVRQRIRDLASAGVCVVVTTSSPADAELVADAIYVLHNGSVSRVAGPDGAGLLPVAPVELLVWVQAGPPLDETSPARKLAALLVKHPDVRGVSWDDTTWYQSASTRPDAAAGASLLLRVRGDRAEPCSAAVRDSVLAADVSLEATYLAVPALGQVRAASEALLRMRRGAPRPFGAPPPPAPPPPPDAMREPAEPSRAGPPPLPPMPAGAPPAFDPGARPGPGVR
jgi:ABC-2 type transport system ATP-binding protein